MFLKRLALEILPLHLPIIFQCWQAEINNSAHKLDQYLQTTCTSVMSLVRLDHHILEKAPYRYNLHECSIRRQWCCLPCLCNNPMDRPVTPEERGSESASTLLLRAQIHLKLSVLLYLAYYAETTTEESMSWTKKLWFPVCQRKWDCESRYGDNWSF